jgi:hypothetical protein
MAPAAHRRFALHTRSKERGSCVPLTP